MVSAKINPTEQPNFHYCATAKSEKRPPTHCKLICIHDKLDIHDKLELFFIALHPQGVLPTVSQNCITLFVFLSFSVPFLQIFLCINCDEKDCEKSINYIV